MSRRAQMWLWMLVLLYAIVGIVIWWPIPE